jgi:hypothetical protein
MSNFGFLIDLFHSMHRLRVLEVLMMQHPLCSPALVTSPRQMVRGLIDDRQFSYMVSFGERSKYYDDNPSREIIKSSPTLGRLAMMEISKIVSNR